MSPDALTLRRAALDEILPLRHVELRPGLPLDSARFDGDDEPATRHFGAFLRATGAVAGCVSCMRRTRAGQDAWQVRGMATRADLVRHGVGRALLRHALLALREEGGPDLSGATPASPRSASGNARVGRPCRTCSTLPASARTGRCSEASESLAP